jgi:hypothetical protein
LTVRAVVFINYSIAPFHVGPVGWGFETQSGHFCYGAKEAVGMQETALPGYPNGAFVADGTEHEMLAAMKTGNHPGNGFPYGDYKYIEVANFNVAAARDLARQCPLWGYTVVGNNCMDDAYHIIKAYANGNGDILPRPREYSRPVDFFQAIPEPVQHL